MGHGPVSPGHVTDTPGRVDDFGFLFAVRSSTVASVTVEFVEFDGGRDPIIMASMVVMMEEMSSLDFVHSSRVGGRICEAVV